MKPGTKKSQQIAWSDVEIAAASDCACACADGIWQLPRPRTGTRRKGDAQPLLRDRDAARVGPRAHGAKRRSRRHRHPARDVRDDVRGDQRLEAEIYASVGHEFNIGSPIQLSEILFEEIGLPKTRRLKTGAYSTDKDTLGPSAASTRSSTSSSTTAS